MNIKSMPIPVTRALKKLGRDIRDARKRRRIPMQLTADRASISRVTLSKIENGDEGVSLGGYAKVIFTMGMIDRLSDLMDPSIDEMGLGFEADSLPKRIRFSNRKKGA